MVGKRLKEARLASGMTQVQLAEKMKVHPKIISCYELEIISPNESEKIELCRMLNISYDYLLGISNAAIPPVQDKRIIAIPDTVSNKDYEILKDTVQQLSTKKRISIHRVSEAISKQTKQLITDAVIYSDNTVCFVCPNCKISVGREYQSYCDHCGQWLKWQSLRKVNYNYHSHEPRGIF